MEEFSSNISDVVDPDNFDFDLDVDFSDIFDFFEPPTVKILLYTLFIFAVLGWV